MCGIIAAVAQRDVVPILLEGLKRLEYRGYDSAGLAIVDAQGALKRLRMCGKVAQLIQAQQNSPLKGDIGIAHTRWATHGKPSELNAHPHFFEEEIGLVHNGIIENYEALKAILLKQGVIFESQTDTEVIVKWIGLRCREGKSFLQAVQETLTVLEGSYALVVFSKKAPNTLIAARRGSPVVIGRGIGENFIASDSLALLPVTQQFIFLEEGDIAEITQQHYHIYNDKGQSIQREEKHLNLNLESVNRGQYRHYMQKEIFEQPHALRCAIEGRLTDNYIADTLFGQGATAVFDQTQLIHMAACGTSFHASLLAKYWIEDRVGISCHVEVASEMRYRKVPIGPDTLLVTLSQSGETADTLAVLRQPAPYLAKLGICNVPQSALMRETQLGLLTRAGPEIGVASTKAFTTQLVALLMLTECLARRHETQQNESIVQALRALPSRIEEVLQLDEKIAQLAQQFDDKTDALFIARGVYYPIAKEAALKLKEISYIHAEAYPAGELKHGPLALVDKNMLVVVLVGNNALLPKLLSNLEEVRARQGQLIILAEKGTGIKAGPGATVIEIPQWGDLVSPIAFTVLTQLLAYHVAVRRGTDVDQPRNLAKSVTVE